MLFITIIIALALELMYSRSEQFKIGNRFQSSRDWVIGLFRQNTLWDGPIGVLLVLFIPVFVIALVQNSSVYNESLYGLWGIILGVLILVSCMRYCAMDRAVDGLTATEDISNNLDESESRAMREILGQEDPSVEERFSLLTAAVLVQANERLFAVIFWFLVFGPAGALLYRLTWTMSAHPIESGDIDPDDEGFDAAVYRLFGILSWVPARITAAGYALAGGFEDALHEWKEPCMGRQYDFVASNNNVLRKAGMGALNIERYESVVELSDQNPEQEQENLSIDKTVNAGAVKAARALVLRTLLLACACLAIVTITGWVVAQ